MGNLVPSDLVIATTDEEETYRPGLNIPASQTAIHIASRC